MQTLRNSMAVAIERINSDHPENNYDISVVCTRLAYEYFKDRYDVPPDYNPNYRFLRAWDDLVMHPAHPDSILEVTLNTGLYSWVIWHDEGRVYPDHPAPHYFLRNEELIKVGEL